MSSEHSPFQPPEEPEHPWWAPSSPAPILVWVASGGVCGSAVGITLHVTGSWPDSVGRFGIMGIVGMGLAGVVSVGLERAHSRGRPTIPGHTGHPTRPVHEAVYLPALVLMIPGLVVLGVTASVAIGSLAPALLFGSGLCGVLLGARRLWGSLKNRQALEALAQGRLEAARRDWSSLAQSRWLRVRTRNQARISLGGLALENEQPKEAEAWFREAGNSALAQAGLAMSLVRQERYKEGASVLEQAKSAPGRQGAQSWIDMTRVELVRVSDGHEAAELLANRLGHR